MILEKIIRYEEEKPSLEGFKKLRNSVNWNLEERGISDERILSSLESSPYCVCAYADDKLIGMVRISGDKEMYGYIQDNVVLDEYQGKGIGKNMMRILLKNIKDKKGYLLGTCPSKVAVEFYSKFGMKKRPENPNGFMYLEIGKDELKLD